ncbi:Predicted O-methyltransferase YrrM [Methylomagnum ishizawai]|uniref:Predicted O-methyltransferase YrrM n=1 Tax=Methylomagnum ishizawai TaxID=1760988 RepID=A0A1Y6CTG4_9GAMM|nr:O-methyltransferase [Methylomagnum ishizawai]SMF93577.1 Predicted O-methyltransferase YrrM [Methylomagnum ishizawai]
MDDTPQIPSRPALIAPVHREIEAYLADLAQPTDTPTLIGMESLAVRQSFPIVGRLCGVFLKTLALAIGARRVFEFGSGFGYSTHWFATAVGPEGRVVCADSDPANLPLAKHFLKEAGLWERVEFRIGQAQGVFRSVGGEFDICYNDADKCDYPDIWRMARERVRPGGCYIADNVLWHGRVARECLPDAVPGWTEAIREHNRLIFTDPGFDAFVNPTRDGMVVARRKTG